MIPRIPMALLALSTFFACLPGALAASSDAIRWITYTAADGSTVYLEDNRKPALYTGNFGDCLGGSAINVTRFDAAYYQDNMTVLFHLAGNSAIANDSLMMYIGVYAYGENRFDLVFNPCNANIYSLCPINSSVPISANGIIPVSDSDVSNVPSIAFSIPDFEGEAILRIFSNTTQQEIACYSGVVTNGNSFSQPAAVGSILGIFTVVAMVASFATAIVGEAVPTMRLHYAHSLSVGVVFAVLQHIFFTGALSVNWPSVLVAWWSNFAWAGGMINTSSMQESINNFIGNNIGNTTQVGAAQAGSYQENLGGGYDISMIYKRAFSVGMKRAANHPLVRDIASEIYGRNYAKPLRRHLTQRVVERSLQHRDVLANASTGYKWYGHPVGAGLPLPGNFSGFAGTLAAEDIRASNAFMTGFLWFLILLVLLVGSVMAFKWALEGLAQFGRIKNDRLKFFRDHWLGYSALVALRTCYIAFFMIMLLTIFQFTYDSSGGVKGVAAIVFIIFFVGIPGAAAYAVWYETTVTQNREQHHIERKKLLGKIPWMSIKRTGRSAGDSDQHPPNSKSSTRPFWKRTSYAGSITAVDGTIKSVHDDEDYTTKFGWLASRFRRSRWWFFTVWILYEFLRAIFYGGASGYALAQVFGLLIIEIVAFAYIIWARPFEGQRLNLLVVYCLGFSKVATVALAAAFDVQFNLPRITTTVIGVVIIVIQGILTIITMVAIVVGAISSYMSVSRNRSQEDFRPKKWAKYRERYFDHLDRAVNDLPPPPKPEPPPSEEPKFGFEMKNVRRLAKIEDEDEEFASEMRNDTNASFLSLDNDRAGCPGGVDVVRSGAGTPIGYRTRASSIQSTTQANLPYGARRIRTASWSTRDFTPIDRDAAETYSPIDMSRSVADDEPIFPAPTASRHGRVPSRSFTSRSAPLKAQASTDSLRAGGDVSTHDSIGSVPAPTVRPRAGTLNARPGSRNSSSTYADGARSTDRLSSADAAVAGNPRGSAAISGGRLQPLSPAQELEEWTVPSMTSMQK